MLRVAANELKIGMVLGTHAMDDKGQILLKKGTCLGPRECEFLARRKAGSAVVIVDLDQDAAVPVAVAERPVQPQVAPELQRLADHVVRIFAPVRGNENGEMLFALVMERLKRLPTRWM